MQLRFAHLAIAEAQGPQALPRWRVPEVNFVVIPRRGQYHRVRLVHSPCLQVVAVAAADTAPPSPLSQRVLPPQARGQVLLANAPWLLRLHAFGLGCCCCCCCCCCCPLPTYDGASTRYDTLHLVQPTPSLHPVNDVSLPTHHLLASEISVKMRRDYYGGGQRRHFQKTKNLPPWVSSTSRKSPNVPACNSSSNTLCRGLFHVDDTAAAGFRAPIAGESPRLQVGWGRVGRLRRSFVALGICEFK